MWARQGLVGSRRANSYELVRGCPCAMGDAVASAARLEMVMGVMVIPSNRKNRAAIRATWGAAAPASRMLVRFVAGDVPCARTAMEVEQQRYGDCSFVASKDCNKLHSTAKVHAWFNYAVANWPTVPWIGKMEDDGVCEEPLPTFVSPQRPLPERPPCASVHRCAPSRRHRLWPSALMMDLDSLAPDTRLRPTYVGLMQWHGSCSLSEGEESGPLRSAHWQRTARAHTTAPRCRAMPLYHSTALHRCRAVCLSHALLHRHRRGGRAPKVRRLLGRLVPRRGGALLQLRHARPRPQGGRTDVTSRYIIVASPWHRTRPLRRRHVAVTCPSNSRGRWSRARRGRSAPTAAPPSASARLRVARSTCALDRSRWRWHGASTRRATSGRCRTAGSGRGSCASQRTAGRASPSASVWGPSTSSTSAAAGSALGRSGSSTGRTAC